MDKHFSIKEVSARTGLSPSNIRYYEREGLIQAINRDNNGIRWFNEKEIEWIQFLGKMKNMDMPIAQMKQYAALRLEGNTSIRDRMDILEQHRKHLLLKIDNLFEDIELLDNKLEIYKQMEKKIDE